MAIPDGIDAHGNHNGTNHQPDARTALLRPRQREIQHRPLQLRIRLGLVVFQHAFRLEAKEFRILAQETGDIDRPRQFVKTTGFDGFEIGTTDAQARCNIGQRQIAPFAHHFQAMADTVISARSSSGIRHGRLFAGLHFHTLARPSFAWRS